MNWFNKHLNLTYTIVIIISLLILVPNIATINIEDPGFQAFIGPILSFILNIGAGAWILRKKGQSPWYLAIAILVYVAFVVLALVLPNNRTAQDNKKKINDADYYKDRETGAK